MAGPMPPLPFQKGGGVAEVSFHNDIIGNVMVYQDRLETNLYSYLNTRKIQNEFYNFDCYFCGQHC